MSLTDSAIRAAKPGNKDRKLTDEKGLYLLVRPTDSKLMRAVLVDRPSRVSGAQMGAIDLPADD